MIQKTKDKESGIAHIAIVILVVVVLAAAGFAGWWVWNKDQKKDTNTPSQNSQSEIENEEEKKTETNSKTFNCKNIFSVTYPASLEVTSTNVGQCLIANVSTNNMPPVGPLPPEQLGLSFGATPTQIATSEGYLADYIQRSQEDAALELRSQEEVSLDYGGTATFATVYGGHPLPHEFYFFVYLKDGKAITTFFPTNSNHKDEALKILKSIR